MNKELRRVVRNWSQSLTNDRVIEELKCLAEAIQNPGSLVAFREAQAEVAGTSVEALQLDDVQVYAILVTAAARLKELEGDAKEQPNGA